MKQLQCVELATEKGVLAAQCPLPSSEALQTVDNYDVCISGTKLH